MTTADKLASEDQRPSHRDAKMSDASLARPDAAGIVERLGQATFVWDISTDGIIWSDNTELVFPGIPAETLISGAALAKLIEPAQSIRSSAVAGSHGAGGFYQIEYAVRISASAPLQWIE